MSPRKDSKDNSPNSWGTLEDIIRTAYIPGYHGPHRFLTSLKPGLNLDQDRDERKDLLMFLTNAGIDITQKTPLTKAACRKYIFGKDDRFSYDEFYQRFSDIVCKCDSLNLDVKDVMRTILNMDDIERFNNIWCFMTSCSDVLLAEFIAKDKHFITTIFNVKPDHLENVRRALIFAREHVNEIMSKKERFIADLLSEDPSVFLANCISSLHFNDVAKSRAIYRNDHLLYNCENILVLLDDKKIKCTSELADILFAINNQAEFNMLVEQAKNLPFIYQHLLKANGSSNDFIKMPSEKFSTCLGNICSAARLLDNPFRLFGGNDQEDVQGDKAHQVISMSGKRGGLL